jgi:hypothetical protein
LKQDDFGFRIGATVQPGAAMAVQGDEPGRSRSGFSVGGVRSRPHAANEVQFVRCPRRAAGVDEGHAVKIDRAAPKLCVVTRKRDGVGFGLVPTVKLPPSCRIP